MTQTVEISDLSIAISLLVNLNKQSRPNTYPGPKIEFMQNCCTVRVDPGRRTGKTSSIPYICSEFTSALVICKTDKLAKDLRNQVFDKNSSVLITSCDRLTEDTIRGREFDVIIMDDCDLGTHALTILMEHFITHQLAAPTFIILGK